MSTYADFQNQNVSEKIALVKVQAAQRLMAWELHSGSIYKLEDFDYAVIKEITENGVLLVEVFDVASVTAGKWYNDRENKVIYLRTSDSTHPNGKFLSMLFWVFWSTHGVALPNDLSTGVEVYWEPLVKSTSSFGVELDNDQQIGFAIEGQGTINLLNDGSYWDEKYEGWIFEQQPVYIYSFGNDLDPSEAKLIFKGMVNGKSFSSQAVTFKLKDTLAALRSEYPLPKLSELSGALIGEGLLEARQRRIYGKVFGYRPTNIDQLVDSYLLAGTVSGTAGGSILTGVGTSFLSHFSPGDEVQILGESYAVASVTSDTVLTINDAFDLIFSAEPYGIIPEGPKTFINRDWLIAGHECRQPSTTVQSSVTANLFYVDDLTDIDAGDFLYVGTLGSGEIVQVEDINTDGLIRTFNSMLIPAPMGTPVLRFCAQNVRINDRLLQFYRDYQITISGGVTKLTLTAEAEKNINPTRDILGTTTFTNASRTVTGVNTVFTSQLIQDQWIRGKGNFEYFQILSIESDTSLTLRTAATYSDTGPGEYIFGTAFDTEVDVLTCDVIGTTDDDLSTGVLLRTAPEIVKHIIAQVDVTDINQAAFDKSKDIQPAYLGFAVPRVFSETRAPIIRDIVNKVNFSVFGSLVQNEDFELEYNILRPNKPANYLTLNEPDILSWSVDSTNDRVVKNAIVQYKNKEYDYETGLPSFLTQEKVSDTGTWLVRSMNTKIVDTVLHNGFEALYHANRWAFLLETSTNVVKIKTKLQPARFQVNDVIMVEHEKLFDRIGGGKRKFAAINKITKSAQGCDLECDDLGNAFNRVAIICETGSPDFDNSDEVQLARQGYITDAYGLINNDRATHSLNVIW